MIKYLTLSSLLLFSSCGTYRVFQDKVPEPIKKNIYHLENEKQGAYYLAVNSTNENQLVADALSRSLGIPKVIENDSEILAENLFQEASSYENSLNELNTKLDKLQGKEIEDTGFNVMPWFSSLGIIVIVLLLVLFPSLITVLFFVLKRTRSALGNIVNGIKEFTESEPGNAENLNALLEKKLDRVEKNLKFKMENHG